MVGHIHSSRRQCRAPPRPPSPPSRTASFSSYSSDSSPYAAHAAHKIPSLVSHGRQRPRPNSLSPLQRRWSGHVTVAVRLRRRRQYGWRRSSRQRCRERCRRQGWGVGEKPRSVLLGNVLFGYRHRVSSGTGKGGSGKPIGRCYVVS